ncbi:MAG: hypothetical protein KF736_08095 [Acidobacteria bacterium]|nr:hypothetical protein [Acidobacteriota bacterium]MCW5948917.1 hypothetical protein [Pyrinomonadaceae bacterium]
MPGIARSEIYFIAAMMTLILVVCVVAVYAFFRTYRREMAAKRRRMAERDAAAQSANDPESGDPEQK